MQRWIEIVNYSRAHRGNIYFQSILCLAITLMHFGGYFYSIPGFKSMYQACLYAVIKDGKWLARNGLKLSQNDMETHNIGKYDYQRTYSYKGR